MIKSSIKHQASREPISLGFGKSFFLHRTGRLATLSLLIAVILGPLALSTPTQAAGASFYASPASGNYNQGDVVRVNIMLNSGGYDINAIKGTVTWSGLQYSSVSGLGGIVSSWISGNGSGPVGSADSVAFEGGISGTGYNGTAGRILTIIFNAPTTGTASVTVNGLEALVGDGHGTPAYCCSSGANFTISKSKSSVPLLSIFSSTHSDESKWYTSRNVALNWYATTAVSSYSWAFDHNPTTVPSAAPSGAISTSYNDVADGVWYFHLRGSNDAGGSTVHFAVHIDNQPPDEFDLKIDNEGNPANPTPKIDFNASDSGSGVVRYDGSIDDGDAFAINSGDHLPKVRPGDHVVRIRAFDANGNVRESKANFTVSGIIAPKILDWTKLAEIKQGLHFIGQSEPGDTVIVYIGSKEVDRFLARDHQIPKDRAAAQVDNRFKDGITWDYEYRQPLLPDTYGFRFARINSLGADSAISPIYSTEIRAAIFQLAGHNYTFSYIIHVLVAIIIFLLLVIAYLLGKIHRHAGLRVLYRPAQPSIAAESAAEKTRANRLWSVLLRRKKAAQKQDQPSVNSSKSPDTKEANLP